MKRIFTALCCAVLLLYGITPAAQAAEQQQTCDNPKPPPTAAASAPTAPEPVEPDPIPLYPAEVSQRTENGVTYIEKVYYLTANDDPTGIPTEDFERNGQHFTLQDVLKNSQIERDTKDHVEEVTVNSAKKDMESILPLLEPEIEVQTEDGYAGVLTLDHTSITVEAAGYNSSSRTVSATRTYPNLSAADVSLIPKTITDNGRTLTLADVQWQNAASTQQDGYDMAIRYTATASYTGTATSQYVTGYVVTASYHGAVTRVNHDVTTYTAVFSSADPAPVLPTEEDPLPPLVTEPEAEPEKPEAEDSERSTFPWALLLLPVALAGLGAVGYFGYKQYRHYINKKRGYE